MVRPIAQRVLPVIALIGLGVSVWLLVAYQSPGELACGPGGGCNTVRACRLASVGGVSWPAIGVAAFGLLLAMSLSTRAAVRRWLPAVGLAGAAVGASLIVLQKAVCGAFCTFCLVTDGAAIAAGVAAWLGRPRAAAAAPALAGPAYRADTTAADAPAELAWLTPALRWTLGGVAALVVALGLVRVAMLWQQPTVEPRQVAELPEPIAREQRPGQATVVEFSDFECPYCRRQHHELVEVLHAYGSRVRFVRKHVPLSFHRHAMDAARAACCAEEQGRGEPMADALYRSEDLSSEGCEAIASRLGLDLAAFRACVRDERTTSRIERDRTEATQSGVEGLPTTFVGAERFDGVVGAATLRASIDRALERAGQRPSQPRS